MTRESDVVDRWAEDARKAIKAAAQSMGDLPVVAREALFKGFFDDAPLDLQESFELSDKFTGEQVDEALDGGYVQFFEADRDCYEAVLSQPDMNDAHEAVSVVYRHVFDGTPVPQAGNDVQGRIQAFYESYGLDDPRFELRSTWEALGFL